ncbi:DUF6521 family protein [Lysinibacillus sp. 1 U-2021]|uniref:three component ABC system middle component n=1 Tax=Lysinibacillus sp. 1 U-2021 TaxID=3039426 RepID=UPI00248057C2|nr:three component ABC system middle component [Lysinibacillus sp. 1 U-2021]WGT39135.1 DUF6521 family protein [Lysinibacillus sp. 1 U-2021]
MKIWSSRPVEVANYYNPAYLGRIIYSIIKSFQSTKPQGVPYDLLFILMPLILVKPYRESLPTNTRTHFQNWIQNNEELKIDYALVIKDIMPYIKEALIFLLQRDLIILNNNGYLILGNKKLTSISKQDSKEIKTNINKAIFVGKWFAKNSDKELIYILLGVKP